MANLIVFCMIIIIPMYEQTHCSESKYDTCIRYYQEIRFYIVYPNSKMELSDHIRKSSNSSDEKRSYLASISHLISTCSPCHRTHQKIQDIMT